MTDFRRLEELLESTPPECAYDPCQELSQWLAVAPAVQIAACTQHLGRVLVPELTWFVHAFKEPPRRRLPM